MIALALMIAAPAMAHEAAPGEWRRVVTTHDRERLRAWRDVWLASLRAARQGDGAATIAADPALYDPDAALDAAQPPAGPYRCRVVKFVRQAIEAGIWGECRIDAAGTLVRLGSDQRFTGTLYPDGTHRSVFLGTMLYPHECRAPAYGHVAGRDMAGLVERIGERRWRLVLPSPLYQSRLDVVDLQPAGADR